MLDITGRTYGTAGRARLVPPLRWAVVSERAVEAENGAEAELQPA